MSSKLAPNLFSIINNIEANRVALASQWVEIVTVKQVFKTYKISAKKFQDGFGVPIIEYFIAVVREEKEVGNCPIMSKLVLFLLEKDITPKDVFDICMGLRKTLVAYLFKEGLIENNPLEVMNELASLFDANLSGVLKIFTTHYQEQQKSVSQSVAYQQKLKQITQIINAVNTKIMIVQNGRIILGNKPFFETVGVNSLKEFYKRYEYAFSFMKSSDIYQEEFDVKNMDKWLKKVYDGGEPFQTQIFNEKHAKEFIYSGRVTTLPESDPVQYIITLNNINAYLEDKTEIKKLMSRDELTGLNNYATFEYLLHEAQEKVQVDGGKLALGLVAIPTLVQENKENKNRIIAQVAETIKHSADETMILSHLEKDKFAIVLPCQSKQECYDWYCSLQMTLNAKNEHITVSLTAVEPFETVNRLLLRAYNLSELAADSEDDVVQTDFEDINYFVNIPNQEQFTNKAKEITEIETSLYYKELPVTVKNKILLVDKESMTLDLTTKQANVAFDNGIIYLEFPFFGFVKADIKHVDAINMTMTVHNFGFGKYFPMQRKKFRVEAEENSKINIIFEDTVLDGVLLNLNEESLAVIITDKKNLYKGALVSAQMILSLEDKIENFSTSATVLKIKKIKKNYKVVLLCHLNNCSKTILHQYIAKRQIEIIKEMRGKTICNNC